MIKATAIRDMQGNWWKAFLLSLIESAVLFWVIGYLPVRIPTETELLGMSNTMDVYAAMIPKDIEMKKLLMSVGAVALLYLFLMAPFSVGMSRYFLRAAKGEKATFRDVFSVYANIRVVFSSIALTLITILFSVISFVVFMIIPVAVSILGIFNGSVILVQFARSLMIVFTLLFVVWVSRYRFISYIYAADETGVFATLYKYFKYMKKRNGECLILGGSYFGWIVMISLMPFLMFIYQCLSNTVYAKYLLRFRGELSFGQFENPPSSPPPPTEEEN